MVVSRGTAGRLSFVALWLRLALGAWRPQAWRCGLACAAWLCLRPGLPARRGRPLRGRWAQALPCGACAALRCAPKLCRGQAAGRLACAFRRGLWGAAGCAAGVALWRGLEMRAVCLRGCGGLLRWALCGQACVAVNQSRRANAPWCFLPAVGQVSCRRRSDPY